MNERRKISDMEAADNWVCVEIDIAGKGLTLLVFWICHTIAYMNAKGKEAIHE